MNKIMDILTKLGISEESGKHILESMQSWKSAEEAKLEEDFKARVAKARKVCIEEIEKEKAELAKKVEIFLEAQIASIQREAQKQAAIGESKVVKTLRRAKAVLEDVTIDESGSKDHQAELAELQQLRVAYKRLEESNQRNAIKAERANKIAQNVLARSKVLESKVKAAGNGKTTVTESKNAPNSNAKPKLGALKTQSSTPSTARHTLTEQVQRSNSPKNEAVAPDIAAIASKMEVGPAFIR